jgi:hypothetical protein
MPSSPAEGSDSQAGRLRPGAVGPVPTCGLPFGTDQPRWARRSPPGPGRHERCGLACGAAVSRPRTGRSQHTGREATPATGLGRLFQCFLFFLEGCKNPVAFVGRGRPVSVCWQGRRNHPAPRGNASTRPAARQPTTEATAATPSDRLPQSPAKRGPVEPLRNAGAGVPRNGVPRQPSHTLHCRSAAAARLTALGYRRNQARSAGGRWPVLATGRFMRPLTRQNHHSGVPC